MPKIRLHHPGGRGHSVFEVRAEDHEVWMAHPVRGQFGGFTWLNRFQPDEARVIARALLAAADEATASQPEVQ